MAEWFLPGLCDRGIIMAYGLWYAMEFVGVFCIILVSLDWIFSAISKRFSGISDWIRREFLR